MKTQLESLESRLLLSNMVWANRGQASDNFNTVFGAGAASARRVVDAVLKSWGTVITNLNQPPINGTPDRNTINFTISMDTATTGFGGGATPTDYAYPTEADQDAGRNGVPVAGLITLDRGEPGEPNAGYWIDPTPTNNAEFTNVLSTFAASPGPAVVGNDIYSTISAEIMHVIGLFTPPARLQTPLNGSTLTKLNKRDPEGNGTGFFYVFDGPSSTQLLTSYDSGGGGSDSGAATHTAPPEAANYPIAYRSKFRGNVQLRGSLNSGNASGGDARVLPTDSDVLLLKDAYRYTVKLPSTIPGFSYNVGKTGRTVVLKGGPDGGDEADTAAALALQSSSTSGVHHGPGPSFVDHGGVSADNITLRREGDELVITMDLGRSGPDDNEDPLTGDEPAFETRIPLADFDAIEIYDGAGDDDVTFDLSGGEFMPEDGITNDGGLGADDLFVINSGTDTGRPNAFSYRSTSSTSAVLTLLPPPGSPPGTLPEVTTLTDLASVSLDGGNPDTSGDTLFVDEIVNVHSATVPGTIPTKLPLVHRDFSAVTLLNANPVTFFRAYNPNTDEHFFTTSQVEFDNAVAHGFHDESQDESLTFSVLPAAAPNAVPVFRLYNLETGTHYITTDAAERDYLVDLIPASHPNHGKTGWVWETTEGYVYQTQLPGTVEIFRLYNAQTGSHIYTDNASYMAAVLLQFPDDWKLQNHLGYAFPAGFEVTPFDPNEAPAENAQPLSISTQPSEHDDEPGEHSTDRLAGLIALPTPTSFAPDDSGIGSDDAESSPTPPDETDPPIADAETLAQVFTSDLGDIL